MRLSLTNRRSIDSFVALGDSFTEGLDDGPRWDGRHRGWADRLAEILAEVNPNRGIWYANLAVRGRLIGQILEEQIPRAIDLRPQLVSLGAGINDALRRSYDLNVTVTALENSVRVLNESGAHVLLFAFGDPSRRTRVLGTIAHRLAQYRDATLAIAEAYDCSVVDFWGVATYDDERMWSNDRLHL